MMKKFRNVSVILLVITVLAFALTGCGNVNEDAAPDKQSSSSEKKIELIGSTSVTPLAQKLADEYNKENNMVINVQGVGSTAGIEAAVNGTADIGMSSRELKDEEKNSGLNEYKIAIDAITVAVNPSNKVESLTMDEVKKIFSGEIKNWKEVGGDDEEIIVISRESGSGTRSAFEEIAKLEEDKGDGNKISLVENSSPIIADGNGAVKSNIAAKKNAIGYLSLGIADESVKKVKIDGVEASTENVYSGDYKISRPFLLLTKGEAKGSAKEFIDYILSEQGQESVEKDGYIKVK